MTMQLLLDSFLQEVQVKDFVVFHLFHESRFTVRLENAGWIMVKVRLMDPFFSVILKANLLSMTFNVIDVSVVAHHKFI